MSFSKKTSLLAIVALVCAVSAFADETTVTSTESVSTKLERSGKKVLKTGFLKLEIPLNGTFEIKADANTTVKISDLVYNSTANKLDFRFDIKVICNRWDVTLIGAPWQITDDVCINSTQERSISIDLSEDKSARKVEVQTFVLSAILDDVGTDPDGFKLNTKQANEIEEISPGTKQAFKDSVRNMAFNNSARKEHIAKLIADHVIEFTKADRE